MASHRTKIAVLIPSLERGGAEQDIVRNFPRLNRDEFEVVVVLFGHPGVLAKELELQGIRYIARSSGPRKEPRGTVPRQLGLFGRMVRATPEAIKDPLRRLVRASMRLRRPAWLLHRIGLIRYMYGVTRWVGRTLRSEEADIMHAFLPHSYVYGMFACWFWRPRAITVMSRLSLNFYKDDQRLIAWLERHVLHRRVRMAIGNSRLILDELVDEGVPAARVRLLYNGIDLTPFQRRDGSRTQARESLSVGDAAFVVVAVGNLWTYKGHRDLIEACALAAPGFPPDWLLLIAGRDQEGNRAAYEAFAAERGLAEHVRLLGECNDVPQLLSAADVFAHPSLHEGLPNAIIEAMAASLPVIATTVGGIPEVVCAESEGGDAAETGWLVPAGDPQALAEALRSAARDPDRREAMGERGRARAESEFSLQRSVRDYERIYRELMT